MDLFKRNKPEESTASYHQKIVVINQNAEQELLDHYEQLAMAPEKWQVIQLSPPSNIPENRRNSWASEKLQRLLTNQLPKVFAKTEKAYAYLLHDYSVVVNLYQSYQKLDTLGEALFAVFYATQQDDGKLTLHTLKESLKELTAYAQTTLDGLKLWQEEEARQKNRQPTTAELVKLISATTALETLAKRRDNRRQNDLLVVEDDKATCLLIRTLLAQHNPRLANSATEALKAYGESFPNLVFLDIGLPDTSGLNVLKAIKQADPEAKVVMLTANSSEKNLKDAVNAGAVGFIAKPFTREKLMAYINKLL